MQPFIKALSNEPKYLKLWSKNTSSCIVAILAAEKLMQRDSVLPSTIACRVFSAANKFYLRTVPKPLSSRDTGTKNYHTPNLQIHIS